MIQEARARLRVSGSGSEKGEGREGAVAGFLQKINIETQRLERRD